MKWGKRLGVWATVVVIFSFIGGASFRFGLAESAITHNFEESMRQREAIKYNYRENVTAHAEIADQLNGLENISIRNSLMLEMLVEQHGVAVQTASRLGCIYTIDGEE
jgi:hypothetical protein